MWEMRATKTVLLYSALGGVLIAGLKLIEFRFLIIEHSVEIYGGLIAAIFAAIGIWLGLRLTKSKETIVVREVPVRIEVPIEVPVELPIDRTLPAVFQVDTDRLAQLGITPRELEILRLIADGLSNREIAARLFVSENTVKTHSSRVFEKLNAKRRTQAVQLAKAAGIIA
jgi:DNA-binding CsgD family transcriptional regulator